jgi:hypothetical protein
MAHLAGSDPNPTALSAFHVSIDPIAEVRDRLGSSGAGTKKKMAHLAGPDSNPTALSAFHVSIDPVAEVSDRLGSCGAGTRKKMAHRGRFELPTPRFVV